MKKNPNLLTQKQAAKLMGVPLESIEFWRKTGVITAIKKDGVRYYKKDQLDNLLRKHPLVSVKEKGRKIEISVIFPTTKEGIEEIKKFINKIFPPDVCKYCGGELEPYGARQRVCKLCNKKQ